jgi:hypothetical protein
MDPTDQTTYKKHHASRVLPENPFTPPPQISIGVLSSSIVAKSRDEASIKPDPAAVVEPESASRLLCGFWMVDDQQLGN